MSYHGGLLDDLFGEFVSFLGDNKLKKIFDSRQIGHQLLNAKESQEEAFAWKFVGDKKILSPIKFEIIKKSKLEFIIRSSGAGDDRFQQVIGSSDKINFFLPHSLLLFQANLKEINHDGSVTLAFPIFLAQVERRKTLRMNCEDRSKIKIQFCKQVLEPKKMSQFFGKNLHDLSGGGMSFFCSRAEAKFFLAGEVVKNIELLIGEDKLVSEAAIVKVQEVTSYDPGSIIPKAWKISLKFLKMNKKDQDFLVKFVFENIEDKEKAI